MPLNPSSEPFIPAPPAASAPKVQAAAAVSGGRRLAGGAFTHPVSGRPCLGILWCGPASSTPRPPPRPRPMDAAGGRGGGGGPPSPSDGGSGGGSENGVDDLGYLLDGLDGDGELAAASVLRPEILDSVVKVYATHCEPNFSLPWQRRRQVQSTSSGFIISSPAGRRLLTNAHSVEHYTVVQVKKRGSDVKYQCKVLAIAHECDLALLTVEEDAFWADTQPLVPGGLPMLQDAIVVIGKGPPHGGGRLRGAPATAGPLRCMDSPCWPPQADEICS